MKNKKKITAIIPARMASTRFPGKPLAKILGLEMIEHIRRRVSLCGMMDAVIVATCDEEIKSLVERRGGMAVMTSSSHERCTDRIAEAAEKADADIIVNIQGDEPMIMPDMITAVVTPLVSDESCQAANLVCPIDNREDFISPNAVKTVCGIGGDVLYFSREPIPSDKKADSSFISLKQLGIIAFRKDFLMKFSRLPQTPLERIESIDMLRAVENGYKIKAVVTKEKIYGVDTPADLRRVEAIMKDDALLKEYMDT